MVLLPDACTNIGKYRHAAKRLVAGPTERLAGWRPRLVRRVLVQKQAHLARHVHGEVGTGDFCGPAVGTYVACLKARVVSPGPPFRPGKTTLFVLFWLATSSNDKPR